MNNKILVVDDDQNICELLKIYLENEGCTVFVANDGQTAVSLAASKSPDLILLDNHAAQNGRLAGLPRDPQDLERADHYADRQRRNV